MGGKAGRFVCIFVPMVLTLAALVFQIMVGLGGTNAKNNYLSNLYFMQADTSGALGNSSLTDRPANDWTDPAVKTADGKIILQPYYTVSLWNYCAGSGDSVARSPLAINQQDAKSVEFCTGRQLYFWFNPKDVWGFNGKLGDALFTERANNALNDYEKTASKWMSSLYILGIVAVSLEILIGIGALFSRLGSLFTTISALVSTAFLFAFALLTTLTYSSLVAAFNLSLNQYSIKFKLGPTMFVYIWLSVACSLVAALFWAFSSCCCSGRSREPRGHKPAMGERAPYTYERVEGPYGHPQQHTGQMSQGGARPAAYEPFRHGN